MRILILLCCALSVQAAAIPSAQSGAWDNPATWTGGVIPGNGDTATIGNGHTITIRGGTTVTVGTSPASDGSSYAIQCASGTGTGVLVVSGTLIFRGPILQCASTWTLSPGATITHDSSQAATPSTANYKWRFTGAAAQTSAYLNAIGTAGSRITINVAAGSGNAGGFDSYNGAGTDGNLFLEYVDVRNWGVTGGAGKWVVIYPFNCSTSVVRGFTLRNATVDSSAEISLQNILGSCTFDFYNVTITNPTAARAIGIGIGNAINTNIATNGRRRMENVFVEGAGVNVTAHAVTLWPDLGFQFSGNYFRSSASASSIPAFVCGGRCVVGASGRSDLNWYEGRDMTQASGNRPPGGANSRLMIVMSDNSNGHNATIMPEDSTIDGWIAWNSLDGDAGDDNMLIPAATQGGNRTLIIKNGVVLRRPSGGDVGTVADINGSSSCTGANCPAVTFNKNTWFVGDFTATSQLAVTLEGNSGYPGVFASVRDNIAHRTAGGIGQIVKWTSATSVADGAFANVDYNWTHNITSSLKYFTKLGTFAEYSAAPGANDQSGDPLFVEVTRTPLTYAQRWDASVTTLDGLAAKYKACYQYRANGTAFCDPRFYDLADMYNWVRAGWRTRNPATWTAGHDGTHVGGVEPTRKFGVFAQ
ncbi:hypothetical protein [Paludibaculum fermentans]|uniref:Uncharacterized protein n=1 Tax=Paludibaculum fermentans TaxID=1473598 RepID=A0A7S7NYW5_PALFE|nr:hypothetical protein [Paludibaculum fermentans]QOY92338.1 hypothetical protein IRI77_37740 [Paludibaculum fermentans]